MSEQKYFWIEVEDVEGAVFFEGGPCGTLVRGSEDLQELCNSPAEKSNGLYAVAFDDSHYLRWSNEESRARVLASRWIQHPKVAAVRLVEVAQEEPGVSAWQPVDPDYEC